MEILCTLRRVGMSRFRSTVLYPASAADLPATGNPVGGDALHGGRRPSPGHLVAKGQYC